MFTNWPWNRPSVTYVISLQVSLRRYFRIIKLKMSHLNLRVPVTVALLLACVFPSRNNESERTSMWLTLKFHTEIQCFETVPSFKSSFPFCQSHTKIHCLKTVLRRCNCQYVVPRLHWNTLFCNSLWIQSRDIGSRMTGSCFETGVYTFEKHLLVVLKIIHKNSGEFALDTWLKKDMILEHWYMCMSSFSLRYLYLF